MACPFLVDGNQCGHINNAVGLPIVIDPTVCQYCEKTYPDPETRKDSYAVLNLSYGERKNRGLKVEGDRPHPPGQAVVPQVARSRPAPPRVNVVAPIVETGEARKEICEECPHWSATNERCRYPCGCANLPRPLAEKGRDCPVGKWRRS